MTGVHALSGAYAIDALDDAERGQFEEHLSRCADCRDEVAGLRETAALVGLTAAVATPADLRARVLDDITLVRPLPPVVRTIQTARATDASVHPTAHRALRARRRSALGLAAAAAVVVGAGVAGVVGSVSSDRVEAPPSTAGPVPGPAPAADDTGLAAARVLAAPDAETHARALDVGGSATVSRSVGLDRAVVLTEGLPAPPPGTAYQTWLRIEGRMVPAGVMARGQRTAVLRGDAAAAEAIGITLEPAGGSPRPTSQPIAYFPLDGV